MNIWQSYAWASWLVDHVTHMLKIVVSQSWHLGFDMSKSTTRHCLTPPRYKRGTWHEEYTMYGKCMTDYGLPNRLHTSRGLGKAHTRNDFQMFIVQLLLL